MLDHSLSPSVTKKFPQSSLSNQKSAMAQEPKSSESKAEIKPPPPSALSIGVEDEEQDLLQYQTPFFKTRSRRRCRDTWLISLFVIFHLIAFVATMWVNDCSFYSHGHCTVKPLGRFSFQPLSENPLLGPSASTLDKTGAIRRALLGKHNHTWRLFASPWLHAGAIHLVVNLLCIIFVGIYLEQEFGPLRVGIIYILSGIFGTLVTSVFVRDSPVVGATSPLFGLLGATFSTLIRNWRLYTKKVEALLILFFVSGCNFVLGLLPYVDNYSNMGGFVSGFLLGFVILFTPHVREVSQSKTGLYEHGGGWRSLFLDRPVLRIVSLVVFFMMLCGFVVAAIIKFNISQQCRLCGYVDCVPSKRWSCSDVTSSCELMVGNAELTLTCMQNGNFRVYPYYNITHERTQDLCTLICS